MLCSFAYRACSPLLQGSLRGEEGLCNVALTCHFSVDVISDRTERQSVCRVFWTGGQFLSTCSVLDASPIEEGQRQYGAPEYRRSGTGDAFFCVQLLLKRGATTPSSLNTVKTPQNTHSHTYDAHVLHVNIDTNAIDAHAMCKSLRRCHVATDSAVKRRCCRGTRLTRSMFLWERPMSDRDNRRTVKGFLIIQEHESCATDVFFFF